MSATTTATAGKRVLVAMSGGVDSSVVAALLKTQGYEVIGMHMQLWDSTEINIKKSGGSCCSLVDSNDARKVCEKLGIPYYVVNARDQFQNDVIDYFVQEYLLARTPNPCVMCNNKLKFSYLIKKANELRCDYVATGHYAKVIKSPDGSEVNLHKALDKTKDQSYFLFGLGQDALARAMMPLGDMLKSYVRKLATNFDLPVADKKDSQEICFIDEDGYQKFVEEHSTLRYRSPGPVITTDGHALGSHQGLYKYTIGQRKGLAYLGLDKPEFQNYYVVGFELKNNTMIVGPEEHLFHKALFATNCNWIGKRDFTKGVQAKAKIRSRHEEADCRISLMQGDTVLVEFEKAQRAITPGQAIVFYQSDMAIGGGWIEGLANLNEPNFQRAKYVGTSL